jgi:site-specific DNA-methyltransferase (adenine-specific)
MTNPETDTVKISSLKLNVRNPRKIGKQELQRLKKKIEDFPKMLKVRGIVVDKDNRVIGGNQRLKALQLLGYKEIPSTWIEHADDFTEEEIKKFIVLDNVSDGEFDWEMLGEDYDQETLDFWGLELPEDFKQQESQAEEDDYVLPDDIKTDIKPGDLIQIDHHKFLCADSTQERNWIKLMEGIAADLVITDPPYNVDYTGKTKDHMKIQNDKKTDAAFYKFLLNAFQALFNQVKPGGAFYIWHADSEGYNFRTAFQDAGILMKQCLVWVKNTMVLGRQDYQWKHEPCLYGWKPGAAHYFTPERHHTTVTEKEIDIDKMKNAEMKELLKHIFSEKLSSTVLRADKPPRSDIHPIIKPILLIAPLIENSSKPGDLILDGFLGSGTTMLTAHQLKRKCYGMEIDPKYCQVIIDRFHKYDPTLKIKINGKDYG